MDVGFLCSSFDLTHPGYILMLKEARDKCDYLVAALHENPKSERHNKNHPIMNLTERFIILKGIRYIDEIAVYETEEDLKNLLRFYKPNIRFLGSEYKDISLLKITGYKLCRHICFIDREHGYSSSALRERVYEAEKKKNELNEFKEGTSRHYSSFYE